jgi:hypothetical protein
LPDEQQEIAEGQAAVEETTNATESAAGEQQEPQTEGEPKAKGGFQRKIDKLTREKADAARDAEYWRQQALRTVEPQKEVAPIAEGKPKEDDFETHAAWVEALTDWKFDSRAKAADVKRVEDNVRTQQQTAAQTFQDRQKEYAASILDFDEVVEDANIPVSAALMDEIVTGESGPALQYFLAKNPDEVEKLNKLSPVALAREIGRLESRFTISPSAKTATVSKAPAPPSPVGKTSSTSSKDPGDMNPLEYREWRRKTSPNFDRG